MLARPARTLRLGLDNWSGCDRSCPASSDCRQLQISCSFAHLRFPRWFSNRLRFDRDLGDSGADAVAERLVYFDLLVHRAKRVISVPSTGLIAPTTLP